LSYEKKYMCLIGGLNWVRILIWPGRVSGRIKDNQLFLIIVLETEKRDRTEQIVKT
jgi:hypothetical protein